MGAGTIALTLAAIAAVFFVAAVANIIHAIMNESGRGTIIRHFVFGIPMMLCGFASFIAGVVWAIEKLS